MRLLILVVASALFGCAVPEAQRRLRDDVGAALVRADDAAAARRYVDWRRAGGVEDRQALAALAVGGLRNALRARAPAARLAAIRAAERFDEPTLFEPVTRLLGDDDEVVRAAAAGAVLRGHADAPAVLTAALGAPDPAARAVAVEALGRKVGALARADLRAALADPDARVREAAVVALAPVAEDEDLRALAAMATRDAEGPVRARAIAALGPDGADVARAALADPYLGARLAAVDALARLLGDRAAAALAPLVARALAPRGAADDRPPGAGDEPPPGAADLIVALHAAARLGDVAAVVRAAAAASDWTVRAAAANAVHDLRAAAPLDPLAADAEPAVALAAARALARLGRQEEARAAFAARLELADPALRGDAAAGLARLGDARGAAALEALAGDADPAVRRAALADFPPGPPVPLAVVAALADEDREVRVAAAVAILERVR
jgi:HEAT repeat protein